MRRHARRAALGALLIAPVVAVPLWTAPAASAASRPPAPSCALPGHPWPPFWFGRDEPLVGNLSPAPGSTVAVGATISFLVASARPFPTPLSRDVVINVNGATVTATAGATESGVPITYANPGDRGPRSANCEVPFSFVVPATISGTARVRVTAYDGSGHKETVSWTVTVQTTALPSGTVGGIGVAAAGGLALMVVQLRRRRGGTPAHS
jgi:hypothetical protein